VTTGWTTGFQFLAGARIRLYTTASRQALEHSQSLIQWASRAPSLVVKWPGRESNHLPPSSAKG